MRRLLLITALASVIALSAFAATAHAVRNTGWPCSNNGQIVPVAPGAFYACSGGTWWLFP